MEQGRTIADYMAMFRRRTWMMVLIVAIGSSLAIGIAYVLPPVYESTAKILVESQQIPQTLAQSTVTTTASERLQVIEQRLMTRDNLLGVIDRLNLFASRPELSSTDKVDLLRNATDIQMIGYGSTQRRGDPVTVSTFTISYQADNAQLAATVANEFVSMVIEQNLQSRNARASETNDFFKHEVDRLSGELLTVEGKISAFKRANESSLPESLQFRRSSLADLEQRMFDREQRVAGLEEQRRTLTKALATGDGANLDRKLTPEERQLQSLEQTYLQQRAIYSESHPAMQTLAARIKALRQAIDPNGANNDKSLREAEVKKQITQIDTELAQLATQHDEDAARKADLEQSIKKTPDVEMALNALNRQHSDLQAQYQQATLKQAEAATGEKLEINQQAERFEVIEQARVPDGPVAPKRMLIVAGGVGASIALALALVVLAEAMNSSIRSPRDLERWHNLHPVVTIPYIRTMAEVRYGRLRMAGVVLAMLVVIPSGLYAIDQYYLPLPLLLDHVANTVGLTSLMDMIGRRL